MVSIALASRTALVDLHLATDIAAGPAFRWQNLEHLGQTRDWFRVSEMINQVGSTDPWSFLVVADDFLGRYAQCCGLPGAKLAVEVGTGDGGVLVVPAGSFPTPQIVVSRAGWIYRASPSQLHSLPAAVEIFCDWVIHGRIDPALEVETPFERPGMRKTL